MPEILPVAQDKTRIIWTLREALAKVFNRWLRFETSFLLATCLFFVGGVYGLLSLWLGVGFGPVAIPALPAQSSAQLFIWEATLITSAIGLALSARALAISEWKRASHSVAEPRLRSFHAWVTGLGLVSTWGSLLVPAYTAALLSVSSFMAVIVVGLIYSGVQGLMVGSVALADYLKLRKEPIVGEPCKTSLSAFSFCVVFGVLGAVAIGKLLPIVLEGRAALESPLRLQLHDVTARIEVMRQEMPVADAIRSEKVKLETSNVQRETQNLAKGITSAPELANARLRLLEAQLEALKAGAAAREAMDAAVKEVRHLEVELRRVQSAAPAMR